jgi:hypothetical protein
MPAAVSGGRSSIGSKARRGSGHRPDLARGAFFHVDARISTAARLQPGGTLLPGYYGGREASVRKAKELGSTQKGIA